MREIIVAHFHSRVHVYKYIVSEFNVVFLLAPPAQGTVYDVGRLTATSTARDEVHVTLCACRRNQYIPHATHSPDRAAHSTDFTPSMGRKFIDTNEGKMGASP